MHTVTCILLAFAPVAFLEAVCTYHPCAGEQAWQANVAMVQTILKRVKGEA